MATDKRFVVKNGLQTENINFVFNDAVLGSSNITATMLSSNTLSFSGSTGQLFSITDSMTGVIFAVNDISGVPSIEVYDDGRVYFAETFGNVTIGNSAISSSRTSTSTTTGILQVAGGAGITGNINVGGPVNTFSGNVGIGSTAPKSLLDVASNGGRLRITQDTAGGILNGIDFVSFNGDVNGGLLWNQSNGEVRLNAAVSYFPTFYSNGAEAMRINTSGNVGIGTSTIQTGYKLQVQGNSAFTNRVGVGTSSIAGISNALVVYGSAMVYGNVDLANPTGGTSGIYFNDGTYQTTAFTGAATPSFGPEGTVQFAGAGNTFSGNGDLFFWDTANSRLGIGTSSPTNVLTVRSTATPAWFNTLNSAVSSNNYEIIVGNGTSTGTTVGYVNNTAVPYGYLSTGTNTRNITVSANGRVGIGGVTAPRVLLDVGGGAVVGASWAGNSNFINPPTNGLSVQGSVGIGTYSPLSTLDVRGGVGVTAASNFGGALSVASLTSNGAVSGTTGTFSGDVSIADKIVHTGDTDTAIRFPAADTFTVETAGNERLRVTSTGDVGIGTISPVSQLHLTTNGTAANRGLTVGQHNTGAQAALLNFRKSRGTISAPTTVATNDYTGAFTFLNYDGAAYRNNAGFGARITGTVASNSVPTDIFFWAGATDDSDPYTNNTVRMVIANTGRVGIATTAPGSTLDVNGVASFRSAISVAGTATVNALTSNGAVSGTTGTFSGDLTIADKIVHSGDTNTAIRFPAADTFTIETNGAEQMRVDSNGNVGIGTSTVNYKLQVNGSFAAKTKSFVIDHPTKHGYKLRYGSLESPYHGIRLTGEEVLSNKTCIVQLPDYVGTLVNRQGVKIQITNIKHGKTLWVDDIDLDNNCFTVATDQQGDYGFFWSFTAVRKDIEPMIVEYPV